MYNTNFSASNPVQTSDEYSFEGTNKMKKKRSSFSLSTLIGAVVFGVLVLGVIAANMGSQQSQDLRNQAAGPSLREQMDAEKGGDSQTAMVTGSEAGSATGTVGIGGEGGPNSEWTGTDCSLYCKATCSQLSCGASCDTQPQPPASCTTGGNLFKCVGNKESCNLANGGDDIGGSSINPSDSANWCHTFQIDAWVRNEVGEYTTTNAVVVWVGDNGQYCTSSQSCDRNALDWDCTRPTPSPTPSCPTYGEPIVNCLVDQATGRADISVRWTAIPGSSSYIVRADHRYGENKQCYNSTSGQWVGWYCPKSSSCLRDPNIPMTCDDRYVGGISGTQTLLSNVELNKSYRVYVQQNGGLNCSTQARNITCTWTPTSPSPSPSTSPSPTPVSETPKPLTCNSTCTHVVGTADPCTKVNPNWFCFGETYPGGNTIIGNCRHIQNPDGEGSQQCTVPTPKPSPIGPMCMSIARQVQSGPNDPDPNTPDVGDYVTFFCGSSAKPTESVSYEFRWMLPDGRTELLNVMEGAGNQTWPYLVTTAGQHHAQCRVCVPGATGAPNCQAWEPLPVVQGAYTTEPTEFDNVQEQSGDPAEFDSINDFTQQ